MDPVPKLAEESSNNDNDKNLEQNNIKNDSTTETNSNNVEETINSLDSISSSMKTSENIIIDPQKSPSIINQQNRNDENQKTTTITNELLSSSCNDNKTQNELTKKFSENINSEALSSSSLQTNDDKIIKKLDDTQNSCKNLDNNNEVQSIDNDAQSKIIENTTKNTLNIENNNICSSSTDNTTKVTEKLSSSQIISSTSSLEQQYKKEEEENEKDFLPSSSPSLSSTTTTTTATTSSMLEYNETNNEKKHEKQQCNMMSSSSDSKSVLISSMEKEIKQINENNSSHNNNKNNNNNKDTTINKDCSVGGILVNKFIDDDSCSKISHSNNIVRNDLKLNNDICNKSNDVSLIDNKKNIIEEDNKIELNSINKQNDDVNMNCTSPNNNQISNKLPENLPNKDAQKEDKLKTDNSKETNENINISPAQHMSAMQNVLENEKQTDEKLEISSKNNSTNLNVSSQISSGTEEEIVKPIMTNSTENNICPSSESHFRQSPTIKEQKSPNTDINVVSSSNSVLVNSQHDQVDSSSSSKSSVATESATIIQNDNDIKTVNQNVSTTVQEEVPKNSQINANFTSITNHEEPKELKKYNNIEEKQQFSSTNAPQTAIEQQVQPARKTPGPSKIRHFFDQGNRIDHSKIENITSNSREQRFTPISNPIIERTCRQLPPKKAVSCVPADCSSSSGFQREFAKEVFNDTQKSYSNLSQKAENSIPKECYTSQTGIKDNYTVTSNPTNDDKPHAIEEKVTATNSQYVQSSSNRRQSYESERTNNTNLWSPAGAKSETKEDKNVLNYSKFPAQTTEQSTDVTNSNKKDHYEPPYSNKLKSSSLPDQQRYHDPYRSSTDHNIQSYPANPVAAHNLSTSRTNYEAREVNYSSNSRVYEKPIDNVVKSNPSSLYVSNPDFSKQVSHHQQYQNQSIYSPSSNSLKQLHMKPPDFTKISSNTAQQVTDVSGNYSQSSVLKSTKSDPSLYKHNGPHITEQNFAEISKKYNYISDLRLKNPPISVPVSLPYDDKLQLHHKSTTYSNLYMKAPGFSMQHFENQKQSSAMNVQNKNSVISEHQPSIITGKSSQAVYADSHSHMTSSNIKHTNTATATATGPYARQFPQLSHDVEMSIVSPKSSTLSSSTQDDHKQNRSDKTSASPIVYNQYHNHVKEMTPYNYEQHHLRTNTEKSLSSGSIIREPHTQQRTQEYPVATPSSYSSSAYLQKKEAPQRIPGHSEHQRQEHHIQSQSQHYPSIYHQSYISPEYSHSKQKQQLPAEQNYPNREQYPYSHSQSGTQSVIQQNVKSKDRLQQEYLSQHHQTQSSQSRPTESPTSNVGRQMQGSPYYPHQQHSHQQQPSPLPHVQSTQKTTSPAPLAGSSSRASSYNQSQPSPSSSSSPHCPPPNAYKTSPSPGAMNPPYSWPSQHVSNSRIPPPHSPITSPHYRITQSPIGTANAPSPQSPIFRQPSPKPSPSPNHLKQSPQMAPLSANYKNPYGSSQASYYPPNEPLKTDIRTMSSNYSMKVEKVPEKSYSEHVISSHYKLQDQKQNELVTPSSSYPQKPVSIKTNSGYPDYPYSPKVMEQSSKVPPQKYAQGMESQYSIPSSKYPEHSMQAPSRHHEKPNYREMINHVYAIRNSTSEEDLNYEIIKRTLNKDISVRRSDSDLSKNIFDCPIPTKVSHHNITNSTSTLSSRSVENIHYMKSPYEISKRVDNVAASNRYSTSNMPYETSRKSSVPDLKKPGLPENIDRLERRPSLPVYNDLTKNDISVTVSKVIKSVNSERSKLQDRELSQPPMHNQSQISEYSNVVISRVDGSHSNEVTDNSRPRDLTVQQPQQLQTHRTTTSSTDLKKSTPISNAVKRESPLDLSVKTVKTKADSTGCDEYSMNYYGRATASVANSQSLKVDFSPNFSKHTAVIPPDVSRQAVQQPQPAAYDIRHASANSQQSQKIKQVIHPQHQQIQQQHHHPTSNLGSSAINKSPIIPPHQQSNQSIETHHQYPSSHQPMSVYQRAPDPSYQQRASESLYQQQSDYNSRKSHHESPSSNKLPSQAYSKNKPASSSSSSTSTSLSAYPMGYGYENYKYHHRQEHQQVISHQQPLPSRLPSPSRIASKKEFEQQSPHLTNIQKMEYHKPIETNTGSNNLQLNYPAYRPHENRKDNHQTNYTYTQPPPPSSTPKRDTNESTNRQSIILNPPMPSTVYDKKSDDYLVNTPQKQKKVLEKPKISTYETQKVKERTELPTSVKDPYASVPIQKCENPYMKASYENPHSEYKMYPNDSRHLNEIYHRQTQQQHQQQASDSHYNQHSIYSHNQQQQLPPQSQIYRDKAQQDYFRKMEINKTSSKYIEPKKHELQSNYNNYVSDPIKSHESKLSTPIGIPSSTPYILEARHRTDQVNDKIIASDYNRKRPNESVRDHQLPEKQVRVDELYRAHLEKTYKQQQNPQQQPYHYQQHPFYAPYQQNRSESTTVPRQDLNATNSKESQIHSDYMKSRYPAYKEEYPQVSSNSNNLTNHHQVSVVAHNKQPQQPQTWYPSSVSSVKEVLLQPYDENSIKRDHYTNPPSSTANYTYPAQHGESETRNKVSELPNNRQIIVSSPLDISQKSSPTGPINLNASNGTSVTPSTHRGADQNVLTKLRTSIEMREHEKQKLSVKKSASEEQIEEDSKPTDIASLLAARIRTKGELKGYTPIPLTNQEKTTEEANNSKTLQSDAQHTPVSVETFSDGDGHSMLDLMDWGSACNDFVEQLQTGTKKRHKRRKSQKTVSDNTDLESEKAFGKSLPGVEYNGDVDKNLIHQIKTEKTEGKTKTMKVEQEEKAAGQTSSDEDKPLFLLRQQSETAALGHSDADKKLLKNQSNLKTGMSQGSDVNHSPLTEKLSERLVRNLREKQRLEQEKRIAARIGSSTSDSEDEIRRAFQRPKKLTRKPRSRASGASTRELSDTDSSGAEDKSMSRNLVRSRRESRKRKLGEKTSTESDSNFQAKRVNTNAWIEDSDEKTKSPAQIEAPVKKEFITKARVKCMKLPSETSENSEGNESEKTENNVKKSKNVNNQTQQESKNDKTIKNEPMSDDEDDDGEDSKKLEETDSTNSKNLSDDESKSALTSTKNDTKKSVPPIRLSKENFRSEKTMTRSKSKKELEQKIANSKILRNEKVVENTTFDRKIRPQEKTPAKNLKQETKSSSTEKYKNSTSKSGKKSTEDLKRKCSNDEAVDKIKKKIGRFQNQASESTNSSSESSEEEDGEEKKIESVSDRLRSKKLGLYGGSEQSLNIFQVTDYQKPPKKQQQQKSINKDKTKDDLDKKSLTPPTTPAKKLNSSKIKSNQSQSESLNNTQKFPPGWEMEVYQYKRALKVPANLITIKGPVHHRVSTSLPDLDPHSSDASESFGVDNSKSSFRRMDEDNITECSQSSSMSKSKKGKSKKNLKNESKIDSCEETNEQPKSIIDVLHSRLKTKKSKKNTRVISNNEPKILPRGNNEAELLPTPVVKENKPPPFGTGQRNLFETEILKTRTRTESRVHKTKELIREVFGGEDRPASAPPELRNVDDIKIENITFDEKYEQYLQKMNNIDFGEKIRKNKKGNFISVTVNDETLKEETNQIPIDVSQIKQEKMDDISLPGLHHDDEETRDTEINACMMQNSTSTLNIKEETQDTNERDTPSVVSERDDMNTPCNFVNKKKTHKNRNGRRKGGSSGFDYIRKKKKPSAGTNTGTDTIKRRRNSPIDLQPTRTENDVSKEIQKWVLNKSVGQSALHKAARLGYLDVIAYCLERLGMNPDPKDNAGYTPLHEACSKGRLEIARVLLQYGANHSETAHSGIRPLHEASENGYTEIVRLLLSYGADPLVTTYSGQTPLMLAESHEMEVFLKNHLQDVQNTGPHKQPWRFPGPWFIFDPDEYGYDVLAGAPEPGEDDNDVNNEENGDDYGSGGDGGGGGFDQMINNKNNNSKKQREKCDSNSNIMCYEDKGGLKAKFRTISTKCTVVLNNIGGLVDNNNVMNTIQKQQNHNDDSNAIRQTTMTKQTINRRRSTFERKEIKSNRGDDESDMDGDIFEFEESEMPLPPLYLLKDEGTEKWVLLNDLCNLLKVKSKDTLLKQICPTIPPSTVNKEILRELKTTDFLEKAICLQLLCAGEKLNIRSSKVVLVKYNENVRNVLGVKTISMKF